MTDHGHNPLPIHRRRESRRMAYRNGGIWALGNGLTSSTLVVYLALELGAPGAGLAISMILAAPRIAGLLLLGGMLLDRFGEARFLIPGLGEVDFYQYSFLFGWITRTMGVLLLLVIIEEVREAPTPSGRRTAKS